MRSEELASKYVPGATWVFDSEEGQSAVFTRPSEGATNQSGTGLDVYQITAREVGKHATVRDFMDDFEADVVRENDPTQPSVVGPATSVLISAAEAPNERWGICFNQCRC